MDQRKLTLAITLLIVILGSVFLGSAVGRNDQTTALLAVVVIVVIFVVIGLGDRIWILIPIFADWTQKVSLLPLPFSLTNLTVLLTAGVWLLSLALRRQHWYFRTEPMDFVLILTLILLGVGYYRNPVGLAALASGGNVGGRPYVEIGIAILAYVLLAGQKTRLAVLEKVPKWILVSSSILAVGGAIASFVPQAGIVLYQFYAGFKPDMRDVMDPYAVQEGIGKQGYLRPLAFAITAYVGARCNPLRLIKPENFWLLLLLMFGTILAALTSYRSALIAVGFYFVAASWLWMRGFGVIVCGFLGLGFTMALMSLQGVVSLPEKVQRSFSFLPGDWDAKVAREGEGTLDWRVELWETVLYGDNIQNWWIGDGFGFPQSELEYFGFLQQTNQILSHQLAEYYLITGDLHSGPLSAAKFAGVAGFLLYMILAIMILRGYGKLWKTLRGNYDLASLRFVVGFFGIAAIYAPFKYLFVYGAYNKDLAILILSAGIYRLIAANVRRELAEQAMVEEDGQAEQLIGA